MLREGDWLSEYQALLALGSIADGPSKERLEFHFCNNIGALFQFS